jgi:hypothetical protein
MSPRLLLLPLAALLAAAPAAEAKPGPKLTVMTRNIYLGGNIALPIGATSRADFEQKTTPLWASPSCAARHPRLDHPGRTTGSLTGS